MMGPEDVEAIATRVAEKTIVGFLKQLGVDASEPFELQRDFAHLRSWRQSIEQVKSKSIATAVTIIVTGIVGLVYGYLTHRL